MMDQTHIMYAYWQQPMTNRYAVTTYHSRTIVTSHAACHTCRKSSRRSKPSRVQCDSQLKEAKVHGAFFPLFHLSRILTIVCV